MANGEPYWYYIGELTLMWARELGILDNAGLVMAAAHEKPKGSGKIYFRHLEYIRKLVGDLFWFLIPGIGTQGGFIEETIRAAFTGPGTIAINSSSGIIFASSGDDYAQMAGEAARDLRDKIREAGGNC